MAAKHLLTLLLILIQSIPISYANPAPATKCERLTSLQYTQATAPSDVSAIFSILHSKINSDVSNVVGINVEWGGHEIHRRVGERVVRSSVTRLTRRDSIDDVANDDGGSDGNNEGGGDDNEIMEVTQCFEVPFTISDVNECNESSGPWAHQCHEPSVCVNTVGSYECVCPLLGGGVGAPLPNNNNHDGAVDEEFWKQIASQQRSAWEQSLNSSSCPRQSSTYQCCPDGHSTEGKRCKSHFSCPVDPCTRNECAPTATCQRTSPAHHVTYTCICPEGTLGNGRQCGKKRVVPKVMFDGVTATQETVNLMDKGLVCGCEVPVVDVCGGFHCSGKHEACTISPENTPICACQAGYVHDPHYGCVDEHPPILQIRPYPSQNKGSTNKSTNKNNANNADPSVTHLTQGSKYTEHGVTIIDDNAEEYLRSLKIEYSRPLPKGCLTQMSEFYVSYTVATPWTTPDKVVARRTVVIDNIDECLLSGEEREEMERQCPELVAMCDVDSGATCRDEVGTYSCNCPEGTTGDGYLHITRLKWDNVKKEYVGSMVPMNYGGGTGCRDTSAPVLEVLGPNPKVFRVASVGRLEGDFSGREEGENVGIESLRVERRSYYQEEIRSMIKSTSGAELCATKTNPKTHPTDCIKATDHTYKGIVDLSSRVSVGEPTPKDGSPNYWRVPYNVMDDAGNKAKTVWRDVVVQEVDLYEFEEKAREAILKGRKEEVENAVKKAVAEERRRVAAKSSTGRNDNVNAASCPKCEVCNCGGKQGGGSSMLSESDCDAICKEKIREALVSSGEGTDGTCMNTPNSSLTPLSRHPWVLKALDWMDELVGPDAFRMLLVGCLGPIILYIIVRVIQAFFFSYGPDVRNYYHSFEDTVKEQQMAQNVTYYTSPSSSTPMNNGPTPVGSASPSSSYGPRRPPTASLSSQRNGNGIFSPQEQRLNGSTNTPQHSQGSTQTTPYTTSPFRTEDGTVDSIYQTKSPITPMQQRSVPAPPTRSYNLRSQY